MYYQTVKQIPSIHIMHEKYVSWSETCSRIETRDGYISQQNQFQPLIKGETV